MHKAIKFLKACACPGLWRINVDDDIQSPGVAAYYVTVSWAEDGDGVWVVGVGRPFGVEVSRFGAILL